MDDLGVHAFITQHYGDKEFIIYPSDHEPHWYREGNDRFSAIQNVDHPDLEHSPCLPVQKSIRVILHAGESAFMPSGWWPAIEVPGTSWSTVISAANSTNGGRA